MKLVEVAPDDLLISPEMVRVRSSKVFDERLRASIEEIGLAEPLKVAARPGDKYLVIDGILRLRAIKAIRNRNPSAFTTIPAYVVDFRRRYEIRYQTDIYQDLLPSQLAGLVEHLHTAENVRKIDIARYIGVSPATLRNYTGLSRLVERGGLFARVVEMMDVGVIPASNPFAWLRLTEEGLRVAVESFFSDGEPAEAWIDELVARARRGDVAAYSIKYVEEVTGSLAAACYRRDEDLRSRKRELGLRRAAAGKPTAPAWEPAAAIGHVNHVAMHTPDLVMRHAARALEKYLR